MEEADYSQTWHPIPQLTKLCKNNISITQVLYHKITCIEELLLHAQKAHHSGKTTWGKPKLALFLENKQNQVLGKSLSQHHYQGMGKPIEGKPKLQPRLEYKENFLIQIPDCATAMLQEKPITRTKLKLRFDSRIRGKLTQIIPIRFRENSTLSYSTVARMLAKRSIYCRL